MVCLPCRKYFRDGDVDPLTKMRNQSYTKLKQKYIHTIFFNPGPELTQKFIYCTFES